ncbi:hypothetical protein [Sphingosinicella sp. YJ22]|uniref:hypothetical protein n=1 Tax=Sphingosinicella sp. YJ22 TaxID=1104780 RepID=UPI00140E483D|nr:hypothetical protein [Sphingosinicella sp. YJ22]
MPALYRSEEVMGARNENELPAIESETLDSAERLTWVRPEVRRMVAGSAEDASGPNVDAITNPS